MLKKTLGILSACLLLGMTSCSDDNPWMGEAGRGAIALSLSTDGRVKDAAPGTRALGDALFEVPTADMFSIHLAKTDGSSSKTYDLLEHFLKEESFPTGTYTLRAFYGKLEDQGFECPFLEGMETVNVLEGRTTEVEVHAKVANSLVTIDYTDDFKNYLHDYSTTIQSSGYEPVKFEEGETRPGFIAPGEVTVTVSFTNPQGQSVTLQPASFTAKAGTHHKITYNVSGSGSDDMRLDIKFDEELTREDVFIDLTEELFTSPAPKITTAGFQHDEEIEFLAGAANDTKYRYTVISHGGLNQVNLSLSSNNSFSPSFGSTIDLIGSTPAQQEELAKMGFDIKGLFKNPDRMAYVDFTAVPQHLPAGDYTLTLQAKDNLMRACEPVVVKFKAVEPTLNVTPLGALAGVNVGSLAIEYNGTHPAEDISFKAQNKNGVFVDAPIETATNATLTRSVSTYKYNFTIKLPDTDRNPVPVKVYLYGVEKKQVNLDVTEPEYSLDYDAFATKVILKVLPDDPDLAGVLAQALNVFDGNGSKIPENRLERNDIYGFITVSGLSANASNTIKTSLASTLNASAKTVTFTTENPTDIQNGDFGNIATTLTTPLINAGGIYNVSFRLITTFEHWYQNLTSISVSTPNNWGNINNVTCNYDASQNKNTWYLVPSTLSPAAGSVTLRTVGYSYNGPDLPVVTQTGSASYYSTATPDINALDKAAGQLFYGASAQDGAEFTSRPSSLTFNYNYSPVNGEKAGAKVIVYSGSIVIGSGDLEVGADNTVATVKIDYILDNTHFKKKATKIAIVFLSSTAKDPAIVIPTDLKDNYASTPKTGSMSDISNKTKTDGWGHTLDYSAIKSYAKGSELTLTNVKLNY